MGARPEIFETMLDSLGIPTQWDLRRNMGVCLAVGCGNAAQGLIGPPEGGWAHDCPCCLKHCTGTEARAYRRKQGSGPDTHED